MILTDAEKRTNLSNRIKGLGDVHLPKLSAWNYEACERHKDVGPQVDCAYRKCGGELFAHQRVGTAWLYAVCHGLLADDPGIGKSNQVFALIALLKERHELRRRALFVSNTPAAEQVFSEASRWIPGVRTLYVDSSMPKPRRIEKYASSWELLIIGNHLLLSDHEALLKLAPFDLVVSDDVDPLLNPENATHKALLAVNAGAKRSFTVNATSLQTHLSQLYAALLPVTGYDLLGTYNQFYATYVRTRLVAEVNDKGKTVVKRKADGYKNVNQFKEKIGSVYLRRRATELSDIRMPMIMPPVVETLEMSAAQKIRYSELQQGVMRLLAEEGERVKHVNALAKFTYGQQICAGLPALGEPDGPGASPKLDRLFYQLEDAWADRKTIAFVKNVGMVRAAILRARAAGFEIALIWGQKQNAKMRKEQKEKFMDDPNCRLLIGTTSLEKSHNLQCANTVVALDTQLNPARVKQLIGRAARAGSPHERVFVFQYLMKDTMEERFNQILAERQAVYDVIFNEESEIFPKLSPTELLMLMRP